MPHPTKDEQPPFRPPLLGRSLTAREVQIVSYAANGYSNAEIAAALYLAEHTVKSHLARTYRKLGARDRPHAVALALAGGLIPLDAIGCGGTAVSASGGPTPTDRARALLAHWRRQLPPTFDEQAVLWWNHRLDALAVALSDTPGPNGTRDAKSRYEIV